VASALRWVTFDDDGELTMTVLSVDGPTRIRSQSSSLTPPERSVVVVQREDVIAAWRVPRGEYLSLARFPRGGRIRHPRAPANIDSARTATTPLHAVSKGKVRRQHSELEPHPIWLPDLEPNGSSDVFVAVFPWPSQHCHCSDLSRIYLIPPITRSKNIQSHPGLRPTFFVHSRDFTQNTDRTYRGFHFIHRTRTTGSVVLAAFFFAAVEI